MPRSSRGCSKAVLTGMTEARLKAAGKGRSGTAAVSYDLDRDVVGEPQALVGENRKGGKFFFLVGGSWCSVVWGPGLRFPHSLACDSGGQVRGLIRGAKNGGFEGLV